jgi:hypothetical protein
MAGHSSDATNPADHFLRTTETEAVVMDLRNKIVLHGSAADCTAGRGNTPVLRRSLTTRTASGRSSQSFSELMDTARLGLSS